MGVLNKEKSLAGIEKLTASSFCRYYFVVQSIRRRRLPVVLVRLGMANTLEQADTFVKHVLFSISIFIINRDMFVLELIQLQIQPIQ